MSVEDETMQDLRDIVEEGFIEDAKVIRGLFQGLGVTAYPSKIDDVPCISIPLENDQHSLLSKVLLRASLNTPENETETNE